MNYKKPLLAVGVTTISIAILLIAQPGIAEKVKLSPIKPTAKQTAPLTDEQQAIMAVRMAKAAVVNIIGVHNATPNPSGITVTPTDEVEGTGFVIDPEGLIISNNHVVSDPNLKYTVMFADGTQYDAKIVGLDKFDDVALLKIDAHNLTAIKMGNSDSLETGQSVFVIGNSLGKYQNTVTRGVVSGLGRSVQVPSDAGSVPRMQQLIQTDAAINPGNSGGPVINLAGEAVGMSVLIDTGGSGLGFAIPMNTITDAVDQLKMFGKVSRPFMGVTFVTITKAFLLANPVHASQGAYINSVVANGPADKAGIKVGDVITSINHEKINEVNELDKVVSRYMAGSQLLVEYVRNGQAMETLLMLSDQK